MAYDNNATVQAMLPAIQKIGLRYGVDLNMSADPTLRAQTGALLAMIGMVIGAMTEFQVVRLNNGVPTPITLADFVAALDFVDDQDYTPIPPPNLG